MSEVTKVSEVTKDTPNTDAPAKAKPSKPVPLTKVIAHVARAKGIEEAQAGKRVRAYIRSHKGELSKSWKHLATRSKGDTYADVPASVARTIITATTKRS